MNSSDPVRFATAVVLGAVACLLGGCTSPGVIFPPLDKPMVFPPAPEAPRIAYVGQLATNEDLKPGRSFAQALGRVFAGRSETLSMLSPMAVCTDGKDRLFVADSNAQFVHVFNLNTREYARWAPKAPRKFSQPVGIAWDPAGRLLVADSVAGVIFVFNSAGEDAGDLGAGALRRPCGIAVDARAGRVFVADRGLHQVLVLDARGRLMARIGQRGAALGQFNFPTYLALDSKGSLYVSDSLNFRVQQFDADLKPIRQIGQHGDTPGDFAQPKGIAVDGEDHVYVIDSQFETVQIFDDKGQLLMNFGKEGGGPGEFWLPVGLFIDQNNRIWVADSYNRRVEVFDYLSEKRQP